MKTELKTTDNDNLENRSGKIPVNTFVIPDNLPFGMKQIPLGWGLMDEAFISFVSFALDSKKIKQQYKNATSVDLNDFKHQSLLEQMIDNSTGYAEDCLGKFMDWLVLNHWGKHDDVPKEGACGSGTCDCLA